MTVRDLDEVVTVSIEQDADDKFTLTSHELPGLVLRSAKRERLIENAPCAIESLYLHEHGQHVSVEPAMMKKRLGEGREIDCFVARQLVMPSAQRCAV